MNEIRFYSKTNKYEVFSNFSWHPILLDGLVWKTNEHYYQAMKYKGINNERVEYIRNLNTAGETKKAANCRTIPIVDNWDGIKDDVMRLCCLKKALTHKDVYDILIETGNATLIEDAPNDFYWGCGHDNTGKNMLGKIWMEIRDFINKGENKLLLKKPADIPKKEMIIRLRESSDIIDLDLQKAAEELKSCNKNMSLQDKN